jgi:hypothetical protein
MAENDHVSFKKLSNYSKQCIIRNYYIMLGSNLKSPVDICIYWKDPEVKYGGTKHSVSICNNYNIPTINMYGMIGEDIATNVVNEIYKTLNFKK